MHNKEIHGPMRLKIIRTQIYTASNVSDKIKEHEDAVNKFNESNLVFFNQGTEQRDNYLWSYILYANGIGVGEK